MHDYADVLADGKSLGALDRRLNQHAMHVDLPGDSTLDLIVEDMERIGDGMASDYKRIAAA